MPSGLQDLYQNLRDEKRTLVRQAVTDNKFHRLDRNGKLHINEMSNEIQHYEQYIKDLQEARALNSYVLLVQEFAHRSLRELRNDVREIRQNILMWNLNTALHKLQPIALKHDQLLAHLQAQKFRNWHICCGYRVPAHRYKSMFEDCRIPRTLPARFLFS